VLQHGSREGTHPLGHEDITSRAGGRAGRVRKQALTAEPLLPPDDPLWGPDNVIRSPHSASAVASENAALTDVLIDNPDRSRAGAPLRNRYDPLRGY
jgi:phosphoglycerate dehydrogenase-like enzyme